MIYTIFLTLSKIQLKVKENGCFTGYLSSLTLTITQTLLTQLLSWDLKAGLSYIKTFSFPIDQKTHLCLCLLTFMSERIFLKENISSFTELYYSVKID